MSLLPSLPDFLFTEKLGKGSYATVYKAYKKSGKREVVAVKCIPISTVTKAAVDNIITEISILKKVKHENIVELKDFQWDSTHIYLILEYCSGGDLSNFIKSRRRLPESVVHKFLQQLAAALKVLRSNNISHMDLKPQNILLTDFKQPVLKLGDFGLSQYLHSNKEATSFRGSPLYMAPEILLKQVYDARVDLWSVGIILYECLFGQAPFSSKTFTELAEKIKSSNPIEIPYGANVSPKCRELILSLLQRDPNQRISFEEFFNHPYVDLEHMPTPETFNKGIDLVKEAVKADASKEYKESIKYYSQALEYLVPHLNNESNSTKRKELRKKLLEYVSRAEELKALSECNGSESSKSVPKNTSLSLGDVIQGKPQLEKGFFLAEQADALAVDGCYEDAGHLYKNALEILVTAVAEETTGPKKDLLYAEVNKWMKKAEDLKSFQNVLKRQRKLMRLNSVSDTVIFTKGTDSVGIRTLDGNESSCTIQ
ncbi:serine/threonine-protein kinase ULK3 isoform X2 [Parasteatoda tepidariorum]|uniref:serine/threonine-protein kinase ULK3 isoform X2 n=1 Tax=Parasteatoda tepidariorum TaxID=114398 RepID=UPI00077F910C|nr:serine/threonine-protein kinase ULK3 [Parasteatoda tepidariorum]